MQWIAFVERARRFAVRVAAESSAVTFETFHPLVSKDERLFAFVNQFGLAVYFDYTDSDFDTYAKGSQKAIEMMNFKLADDIMKNKTNNPKNSEYNIIYDGTINMQSVMNA